MDGVQKDAAQYEYVPVGSMDGVQKDPAQNNQWLTACEEGDGAACSHMARSSIALAGLMKQARARDAVNIPRAGPGKPGFVGSVLSFLGLGDNDYSSGVRSAPAPAKMNPDVGFMARGIKGAAVYNDGTTMYGLSDQRGLAAPSLPVQSLRLGSIFSDAAVKAPKPVRYH
mmetsp:Transcript_45400/g.103385  ORF Transcript_45400/g.103385 Transcript_45400/m.103385 type:complete len:170 (+) Transcript_45400:3-512(+)